MAVLAERVDRLEEALREFTVNVGIEFNKLYNSQMRTEAELRSLKDSIQEARDDTQALKSEMKEFKDEMLAFKDEMKEFKDEMLAFKDEMKEFKDEMLAFKDEMKEFKDEMLTFKDEMLIFKDEMKEFKDEGRQQNREMNRRWGELANKLGTLVEDLVAPSLPRIVRKTLGQDVMDLSVRRKRKLASGRQQEYDALAITADTVCLVSVKSTLRSADIDRFVQEDLPGLREFFPEYQALPLVGIVASLMVDESVLNCAERQGLIVLAVGDQIMEVKNTEGFVLRRY